MRWLVLGAAMMAGEVQALSCARPDVVRSFAAADAAPEITYVLKGRLRFDEALLPQGVVNAPRAPAAIPATFAGVALGQDGFTIPYERAVILQPACAGPWCGSAQAGAEAIMFATVRGDDLVITASPCGGKIFYSPTNQMVRQLTACMQGDCQTG